MEQPADIQILLTRLEQGTCSPEEAAFLVNWLAGYSNEEDNTALLAERFTQQANGAILDPVHESRLREIHAALVTQLKEIPMPARRVRSIRWMRWAAAVILMISATIALLLFKRPSKDKKIASIRYNGDAAPGRNGALLTLADGKTILLDSVGPGNIANLQGMDIDKTGEGKLSLHVGRPSADAVVAYHKLSTPKARKFSMRLPDGTEVWLNAASSVSFPSAFVGKERTVTITGEVYFEVAQDKEKPFIVKTASQNIQVLGTSFNINAYDDEKAVTTTLATGSIRVSDGQQNVILKPGEQATDFTVTRANLPRTMAWKNGAFYFEETDLRTIMRQIGRWYDVNVVYAPDAPSYDFNGTLPDNLPVSEVLKLLELTELVHFEIEGNTITVKKWRR